MRVGIYLGRGWGKSDLQRDYLQSLVAQLVFHLPKLSDTDELVFIGDDSILAQRLLEDLSFGEVLTAEVREGGWYVTAGRFFRKLPNGARCRVLFRVLEPSGVASFGSEMGDQFLIPFYVKMDKIDVLHVFPSGSLPFISCPQILTALEVPEQFRARSLAEKSFEKKKDKPSLWSALRGGFTWAIRSLRRNALTRATHVICFTKEVGSVLNRRAGVRAENISVIQQGLEPLFVYWGNMLAVGQVPPYVLDEIDPGYCLTFYFREEPECFLRSLEAWRELEEEFKEKKLIVATRSRADARSLKRKLKKEILEDFVYVFKYDERDVLPGLIFGADVVLQPGGRNSGAPFVSGISVLETEVVCGQLEDLVSRVGSSKRLHLCDVSSPGSVLEALYAALEAGNLHQLKSRQRARLEGRQRKTWSEALAQSRLRSNRERLSQRTIKHVATDFFEVYRNIDLRYNARQS